MIQLYQEIQAAGSATSRRRADTVPVQSENDSPFLQAMTSPMRDGEVDISLSD